jgi:hypothetical protein
MASAPDPARLTFVFSETGELLKRADDHIEFFWQHVQRGLKDNAPPFQRTSQFEGRVKERFPIELRSVLISQFNTEDRFPGTQSTTPAFAFKVVAFRYGSLKLDVDVAGVKGLLDFFNNNIDLLCVVLAQYAPVALARALTGYQTIEGLDCSVEPSAELERAFTQSSERLKPSKLATINWAWLASNTSLLLPVVLALWVLYIAFQSVMSEREDLRKAEQSLQQRQTEIIQILSTNLARQLACETDCKCSPKKGPPKQPPKPPPNCTPAANK